LIDDVADVTVDRDEKRELLTIMVKGRDGTPHPARALSDGTLRFLALAIVPLSPESQEVICVEEPENGIHPERIPAMLRLLRDIATDPSCPIGPDNPLRQVIINTHSPSVVLLVPDDCLLVAEPNEMVQREHRCKRVVFSCLDGTWRASAEGARTVAKGRLLYYLNPVGISSSAKKPTPKERRVVDRYDMNLLLPIFDPTKV
jgi:hypothetical protein